VSSVTISPDSPVLQLGGSLELEAIPRDQQGRPLTRAVSWTSTDEGVATVDGSGRVRALAVGTVSVRATSGGVSASVMIRIAVPAGLIGTYTLRAAREKPLPAIVFDEHVPELGGMQVEATDGSLTISENGRYIQRVRHRGHLDGVPFGLQAPRDEGVCAITIDGMTCVSDRIQGYSFNASYAPDRLHVEQDLVKEPRFPRPVVYSFERTMHAP